MSLSSQHGGDVFVTHAGAVEAFSACSTAGELRQGCGGGHHLLSLEVDKGPQPSQPSPAAGGGGLQGLDNVPAAAAPQLHHRLQRHGAYQERVK